MLDTVSDNITIGAYKTTTYKGVETMTDSQIKALNDKLTNNDQKPNDKNEPPKSVTKIKYWF